MPFCTEVWNLRLGKELALRRTTLLGKNYTWDPGFPSQLRGLLSVVTSLVDPPSSFSPLLPPLPPPPPCISKPADPARLAAPPPSPAQAPLRLPLLPLGNFPRLAGFLESPERSRKTTAFSPLTWGGVLERQDNWIGVVLPLGSQPRVAPAQAPAQTDRGHAGRSSH